MNIKIYSTTEWKAIKVEFPLEKLVFFRKPLFQDDLQLSFYTSRETM